jgi:hypothetical protein
MYTPDSEIESYLDSFDTVIKQIKEEIYRISWYMRGGVSSLDLMHYFTRDDRIVMNDIIKENIDLTQKSGLPLL